MERALAVGPDANGKQDLLKLARELIEEQLQQGETQRSPSHDARLRCKEGSRTGGRNPDAKGEAGGDGDDQGCDEGDQPQACAGRSLRAEAPEFVPAPKEEQAVPVQMMPGSPCGNFQPVMCVQGVAGSVPQMMQCQAIPVIAIPVANMPVGTSAWGLGMMMPQALNSTTAVTDAEAEALPDADVSLDTPTVSDVEEDRMRMHCPKMVRPKADRGEEQILKPESTDGEIKDVQTVQVDAQLGSDCVF